MCWNVSMAWDIEGIEICKAAFGHVFLREAVFLTYYETWVFYVCLSNNIYRQITKTSKNVYTKYKA